jgi:WD40 repeat protein
LDAKKVQKLWSAEAHTSVIRSMAWSPDGSRIASGSEDRTAKIWDAEDGRELLTLDAFSGMVCAVVWSPDGRRLATADEGSLRIWDATEAYEADLLGANEQKER